MRPEPAFHTGTLGGTPVLVVDNYDSFVFTLASYLVELGAEARVHRHDEPDLIHAALRGDYAAAVISPGPCGPAEAGISVDLVRQLGERLPILGVCLGHQCIGAAFGARVGRARRPMHGRTSLVTHDGSGCLRDLPSPLRVTRYHSLIVEEEGLPGCLRVTARSEEGEIMGLAHREWPVEGVQFHPEAALTEHGHHLLRNFLEGAKRQWRRSG